jgi:hypothetical protein
MHVNQKIYRSIERYREAGGVLEIAIFEDAADELDLHREAIQMTILRADERHRLWLEGQDSLKYFKPTSIDGEKLKSLPGVEIDLETFHGRWIDHDDHNLRLSEYGRQCIQSGSVNIPNLCTPGEFGYAFMFTPYGLQLGEEERMSLYRKICTIILPRREGRIMNWHSEEIAGVSDYFDAGQEWWGCFAFTIFDPERAQIAAVLGSTTD